MAVETYSGMGVLDDFMLEQEYMYNHTVTFSFLETDASHNWIN